MKVFKYQLNPGKEQFLQLPMGSKVLSVQEQNGQITLWALVRDENPSESRLFAVFGTGWDIPDVPMQFIGTVQLGWTVWHVFEVK